jgi:hypothetical protein
MDRDRREAELRAIAATPGGKKRLQMILIQHLDMQSGQFLLHEDFLIPEILEHEFPPAARNNVPLA